MVDGRYLGRAVVYGLLPVAVLARQLAFAAPDLVERLFSQGWYPLVARVLGGLNSLAPVPVAELVTLLVTVAAAWAIWRFSGRDVSWREVVRRGLTATWFGAGVVLALFLLTWGFHYARPPLRQRLALDLEDLRAPEVLALAGRFVDAANSTHAELRQGPWAPTVLPVPRAALDSRLDRAYRRLQLPGDALRWDTSPAKPLLSSALFSRLGISGIFIPFTGEPLFNAEVPDASWPVTMAHEKAHQRGITDEGEANLAAVLACLAAEDPYARYAATLYAGSSLIGAAARYEPDAARELAGRFEAGPRQDLRAIREFWLAHRGAATRAASRVNDAFLRSNRVEGGVQSYGRVASMLVGVERAGRLTTLVPAAGVSLPAPLPPR